MATEISTPAELDAMRLDLTADYILTSDIDMTGFGNWTPVGDIVVASFSGSLDGDGYKISNLVIGSTSGESQRRGLFGSLAGSVFDLGVENASFSSTPNFRSGAIAGASTGTIERCWATGDWTATGYYLGGIVGSCSTVVTDSYFRGDLTLGTQDPGPWSGGVIGAGSGHANKCHYVGGIQRNTGEPAAPGGIDGGDGGVTTNSFFDSDVAIDVNTNLDLGTPQTTAEMKDIATFEGATSPWNIIGRKDLAYTWGIDSTINDGYPFLQNFHPPALGYRNFPSPATTSNYLIASGLNGGTISLFADYQTPAAADVVAETAYTITAKNWYQMRLWKDVGGQLYIKARFDVANTPSSGEVQIAVDENTRYRIVTRFHSGNGTWSVHVDTFANSASAATGIGTQNTFGNNELTIGIRNADGTFTNPLLGRVYEVAAWNEYELTQTEVENLLDSGQSPDVAAPTNLWRYYDLTTSDLLADGGTTVDLSMTGDVEFVENAPAVTSVTVDNTGGLIQNTSDVITTSHDHPIGSNRVYGIYTSSEELTVGPTVTATYGGETMTSLTAQTATPGLGGSGTRYIEIFYLDNPTSTGANNGVFNSSTSRQVTVFWVSVSEAGEHGTIDVTEADDLADPPDRENLLVPSTDNELVIGVWRWRNSEADTTALSGTLFDDDGINTQASRAAFVHQDSSPTASESDVNVTFDAFYGGLLATGVSIAHPSTSSTFSITSISDTSLIDGQTGVIITGTGFGT